MQKSVSMQTSVLFAMFAAVCGLLRAEVEQWVYLPLKTSVVSNTVTRTTLKATLSDGKVTVTGISFLDYGVLDLALPVVSEDGASHYVFSAIGNNAFKSCTTLDTVVLPQTLESIGDSAFLDCTALTTLQNAFPPNLRSIGKNAFQNDAALTSELDFRPVETIGEYAFDNATQFAVADNCLTFSNIVSIARYAFGANSAKSCVNVKGADFTCATNVKTICGFRYTGFKTLKPSLPPTVESLSSYFYSGGLTGDVRIANAKFKGLAQDCFRGTQITMVDMTGSALTNVGNMAFVNKTITNVTFAACFKGFATVANWPFFYDMSELRDVRFQGDPPQMSAIQWTKSFYAAWRMPKWNARWRQLVTDPSSYPDEYLSQTTFREITPAYLKLAHERFPDEPYPTREVVYAGFSREQACAWEAYWYPDAPTAETEEPLNYFDVMRYDGGRPECSGTNDGASGGWGADKLFNGTTYITNTTGTATADKAVKGYLAAERWLGSSGATAEMSIPETCPTARRLKLKSYRVYQLSGSSYANGRAPTVWTLKGRKNGSDDWVVIDSRTDVRWGSATDPETYPYAQTCQVPARVDCVRSFDVPEAAQGVYVAFRFEPSASYNLTNVGDDTYPFGLMEIEFYGELPSPAPVVSGVEAVREGWKDIEVSAVVSSVGEGASWARGVLEVSAQPDFATVVSRSGETAMTAGAPVRFTVGGLVPDAAYYARLAVSNDLGGVTRSQTVQVRTIGRPFELGELSVTTGADGRVKVSLDVLALYADGARASVFVGSIADPSNDPIATVDVSQTGVCELATFDSPGTGPFVARVVFAATADGVDYSQETSRGLAAFWMLNDAGSPTSMTNAVLGQVMSVQPGAVSELSLKGIVGLNGVDEVDLTRPIYAPDGGLWSLVSVGTVFAGNAEVRTVLLPDSVTVLASGAFDCKGNANPSRLATVRLPQGLKVVPYAAFRECRRLAEILPQDWTDAVETIGDEAFYDCLALDGDFAFPRCRHFGQDSWYWTKIRSLDLSASVVTNLSGFWHCEVLTNVTPLLPPSVVNVAGQAFSSTPLLQRDLKGGKMLKSFGTQMYTGFTSVDLSASRVTSISLRGSKSLTNAVLPKTFLSFPNQDALAELQALRVLQFLGDAPRGLVTASLNPPTHLLVLAPRGNVSWQDYLATNATVTALTAAQKTTFRKNYPGRRLPAFAVKFNQDNQDYDRFFGWVGGGLTILIR